MINHKKHSSMTRIIGCNSDNKTHLGWIPHILLVNYGEKCWRGKTKKGQSSFCYNEQCSPQHISCVCNKVSCGVLTISRHVSKNRNHTDNSLEKRLARIMLCNVDSIALAKDKIYTLNWCASGKLWTSHEGEVQCERFLLKWWQWYKCSLGLARTSHGKWLWNSEWA